jgi:hypothetical protein
VAAVENLPQWTAGGHNGRKLYKPIHTNPQYIGLGDVVWRESTSGPPPIGAYYCVNKAFVRIGRAVPHNDCVANNNCVAGGAPMLYRSFGQSYGNITTTPESYIMLSYDQIIANCKGVDKIDVLRDISSADCNYVLDRLYTSDDIKTGKADFCAFNPGWCDRTVTKFCTDYPNHSWCDCLNTTSRELWKEVDALLVPAAKAAPLACKSPFCNARNDVFKTSQMAVDVRSCPDIRYIDQSVRVDGQGNITHVSQSGNIGGDQTNTSTSTTGASTTTVQETTIIGMSSTVFYILLFLFIVVLIVISIKFSEKPSSPEPAQSDQNPVSAQEPIQT